MKNTSNRVVTGVAATVAAAGLVVGGISLANADENGSTDQSTTQQDPATGDESRPGRGAFDGNRDPGRPMRSDEELLTGDTADKVTAAAEAEEPGATIERVETDSDGVYEAHMVREDGTHVTVTVDASFEVTSVREGGPGGPGRPGGHGPGGPGGHGPRGDGDHGGGLQQDDDSSGTSSPDPTDANGTA